MTMARRRPVSLIAACSLERVIGRRGRLPWQLPADWSFFMTATRGHVLLLGRRSFEELRAPLPQRHTIVVSASLAGDAAKRREMQRAPWADDVAVAASLDDALALAHGDAWYADAKRIFVGGGERLYREALERGLVESCLVTRVHTRIEDGDAFLPEWTRHCPRLQHSTSTTTNGTW